MRNHGSRDFAVTAGFYGNEKGNRSAIVDCRQKEMNIEKASPLTLFCDSVEPPETYNQEMLFSFITRFREP